MARRDPLDVDCPLCERKAGYPCQNLSGFAQMSAWYVDELRGGLIGKPDAKRPHRERVQAAAATPDPGNDDHGLQEAPDVPTHEDPTTKDSADIVVGDIVMLWTQTGTPYRVSAIRPYIGPLADPEAGWRIADFAGTRIGITLIPGLPIEVAS